MRIRALLSATAFLAIGLTALPSHAELKLDGRWKQSALREDFAIQQWLDAGCGPPPQSTSTGGGEVVAVRMEGDELAFVGGGRVYRTNQCYDPMPSLARASHSRASDGKTWRTRCVTPAADPRKTVLNTLVVVTTESHIDLIETGRYEITLENGRCMADVKRTRSFDLLSDEAAPAAASTAPPTQPQPATKDPAPPPRSALCGNPGEPTKLEIRPSKKLLRTGESFKFRGLVLDAHGCETKTATSWKLAPEAVDRGVAVDGAGNVSVGKDAPEGSVEIVATAAGKDARVVVEVTSPSRYDELLARSGLNASGENDEASTATIASQSIGAGEGRVEDRSRERRLVFLAIVGGALFILAIVAAMVLRRSRRAKRLLEQADERHETRVRQVLDRRKRREAEHADQMRAHVESVRAADSVKSAAVAKAQAQAKAAAAANETERVCSACGRELPPRTAFCPHDGTPLSASAKPDHSQLPYPAPAAIAAQQGSVSRGKICPTCGERFEGVADFCGKDGTQLVLLN